MQKVRVVVLDHECVRGSHFDLMVEDPAAAPGHGLLLTWRVGTPPEAWGQGCRIGLIPLAAHRRDYLTYEGPLSGDRGRVIRIDEGLAGVEAWTPDEKRLSLELRRWRGRVVITAATSGHAAELVVLGARDHG